MIEFDKFLAQAERAWGRKIAAEAARIWREQGPEAAAKFLRGFQLYEPPAREDRRAP
jgi:hypothetical protein